MSIEKSTNPPTYSGVCEGCDTYYSEIPLSDVDTSHGYKTIRCSVCPNYVGVTKEISNGVTIVVAVLLTAVCFILIYLVFSAIVGSSIGF